MNYLVMNSMKTPRQLLSSSPATSGGGGGCAASIAGTSPPPAIVVGPVFLGWVLKDMKGVKKSNNLKFSIWHIYYHTIIIA